MGLYRVAKIKSGLIYTRKKGAGNIYLYNKGWFRGEEKNYVVSLVPYNKPRINTSFKTKKQALIYLKGAKKL